MVRSCGNEKLVFGRASPPPVPRSETEKECKNMSISALHGDCIIKGNLNDERYQTNGGIALRRIFLTWLRDLLQSIDGNNSMQNTSEQAENV